MAQSSTQHNKDVAPQQYRNFYKMELDNLVKQKNEQKRIAKEQEERERQSYNERVKNSM